MTISAVKFSGILDITVNPTALTLRASQNVQTDEANDILAGSYMTLMRIK